MSQVTMLMPMVGVALRDIQKTAATETTKTVVDFSFLYHDLMFTF